MKIKINRWVRGKTIITGRLVFAGGYPKYHILPAVIKWGKCLSVFWLDTELVFVTKYCENIGHCANTEGCFEKDEPSQEEV